MYGTLFQTFNNYILRLYFISFVYIIDSLCLELNKKKHIPVSYTHLLYADDKVMKHKNRRPATAGGIYVQ